LKRQLLVSVICAFFLFLLDGCTHYYYAPNQHNVPLFKEKNEVRLSGAYILGDEINGCDVQAAYAATKEFAVLANALVLNPNATVGSAALNSSNLYSTGAGKGQLYELGAGYYKPIPSEVSAISRKFVFETYGVLGLGNSTNYYGSFPQYNVTTNLFKAYVQPSIGFTTNLFDIIVSAKIGTLYTFGIKSTYPNAIVDSLVQYGQSIKNDLNILYQNRTSFFFEPAFTFRIGFKYVKFHFQVGGSLISGAFNQLTTAPVYDFGITIFIAHRFWQKDDRPKEERWKEIWD
jgi:hypothetical protein